jgi:3-hydroxyacyl-[acyl-carrier-protein] dehydratase
MGAAWLPHLVVRSAGDGRTEGEFEVPADSPWFAGHFPGRPILPGVAWLVAVADVVREGERQAGRAAVIEGFRNVRFRRLLETAGRVGVVVQPSLDGKEHESRFEVRVGREAFCQGLVVVRSAAAGAGARKGET